MYILKEHTTLTTIHFQMKIFTPIELYVCPLNCIFYTHFNLFWIANVCRTRSVFTEFYDQMLRIESTKKYQNFLSLSK